MKQEQQIAATNGHKVFSIADLADLVQIRCFVCRGRGAQLQTIAELEKKPPAPATCGQCNGHGTVWQKAAP
jgi:DnaJ-class molecular chaperone